MSCSSEELKKTSQIMTMTQLSTLASVTPDMRLIDVNGAPHVLTEHQVMMMVTVGWITFLAAWLMNILNNKVHPSSVNFGLKNKMFIYIFGKKYNLHCIFCCRRNCCTKGLYNQTQVPLHFTRSHFIEYLSLGNRRNSELGEDIPLEFDGLTEG